MPCANLAGKLSHTLIPNNLRWTGLRRQDLDTCTREAQEELVVLMVPPAVAVLKLVCYHTPFQPIMNASRQKVMHTVLALSQ